MTPFIGKQKPDEEIKHCLHCGKAFRVRPAQQAGIFRRPGMGWRGGTGDPELFCEDCLREGWEETTQNQCGNCHKRLNPEDRYCRYCGTKRGDGAFAPHQNLMQCIYGPMPVERVHVCSVCGYQWTTCLMIDREDFCPKCGGKAPYTESEDPYR